MKSLWFVVPVQGRSKLASICLQQLRLTCEALKEEHRVWATAVVVGDDENLETARELGFGTVRRNNDSTSRKFNDGIQFACDKRHNPHPADYVVPCGSDDWIDHRILHQLPEQNTVLAFKQASFVSEDGTTVASRLIDYPAGVGIRVYTRHTMYHCGYRPADEDLRRGCDTSILLNLTRAYDGRGPKIVYGDQHEYQIVDWKSPGEQLNAYGDVVSRFQTGTTVADPFEALADVFPADSLNAMAAHYGRIAVAA